MSRESSTSLSTSPRCGHPAAGAPPPRREHPATPSRASALPPRRRHTSPPHTTTTATAPRPPQVQTTIVPVVLMFRVEDLTNITDERRAELIAYFDAHELPHVISETHFGISADMQHDSAFIHKLLDDHILPYVKAVAPTVTTVHARSDGCKAQFKCAAHFDWVSRYAPCRALHPATPLPLPHTVTRPLPRAPPRSLLCYPHTLPSLPSLRYAWVCRQSKEGCGLIVNWSFFESCHGKCFCDPEGGTLKNAARRWELHGHEGELARAHILKGSFDFYKWVCDQSGLATPVKALEQKHGRGIFRRFFYWIPSKGVGAVDRSHLPKFASAKGSSSLHEFVDIGVPSTVSTRRAACHQDDACWKGRRDDCVHRDYCGTPRRLVIAREAVPAAAAERMERAALNRDAAARAEGAKVGTIVCVETHKDEQTFPWVIGSVVTELKSAPAASPPYDSNTDAVRFEPVKFGEPALELRLYEALQPGSTSYCPSTVTLWVTARRVRVIDVELVPLRTSGRVAVNTNVTTSSTQRMAIEPASLLRIRAEMPTADDSWEVERVTEYRCLYGTEQWLVKWKGYGEERNTWEPWSNLLTASVEAEAKATRTASLPRSEAGLGKVVMVTLKAALEERGLDTSGPKAVKAALVSRLLEALNQEDAALP